jgi:hypothetical protein
MIKKMEKLITLSEIIEGLESAIKRNKMSRTYAFNILIEKKAKLDQLLTEEMFEGETAIFEGFRRIGNVITYKDDSKALLIFAVSGRLAWDYITEKGMQETHYFKESPTLHDLAQITKDNPITLK